MYAESVLQAKCYTWFHNTYPLLRKTLWRVENERKRTRAEQGRAKASGTVAGVSDFMLIHDGHLHCIELKTPSGRQSASQKAFQSAVEAQGASYHVVRSLEEFKMLVARLTSAGRAEPCQTP